MNNNIRMVGLVSLTAQSDTHPVNLGSNSGFSRKGKIGIFVV